MGNEENSKPYSGVSGPLEKARRPTPMSGLSGTEPVSVPAAPLAILPPETPHPAPVALPEASAVEQMTPTSQPSSRVSPRNGDITAVPAISQASDPDSGLSQSTTVPPPIRTKWRSRNARPRLPAPLPVSLGESSSITVGS